MSKKARARKKVQRLTAIREPDEHLYDTNAMVDAVMEKYAGTMIPKCPYCNNADPATMRERWYKGKVIGNKRYFYCQECQRIHATNNAQYKNIWLMLRALELAVTKGSTGIEEGMDAMQKYGVNLANSDVMRLLQRLQKEKGNGITPLIRK